MTSPQPTRNGSPIWIAAIVVVVIAGIVAVIAARGSNDDTPAKGQTGTVSVGSKTSGSGGATPTTVKGADLPADALPEYDAYAKPDPAIGMKIPTVTGQDFGGDALTIGPDGKAKIILFVAHWCPHCQREVPLLKAYLDDHPMPDDVQLLTVSTSVKPGADNYPPQAWLEREGWSAPVLADDENSTVAATFGLSAFPYFVAVDADGKVVLRASGELSEEQFAAAIKAAQKGSA